MWAPLVAVRASGGTRKDGPGPGGGEASGEEAGSKASSSGEALLACIRCLRIAGLRIGKVGGL